MAINQRACPPPIICVAWPASAVFGPAHLTVDFQRRQRRSTSTIGRKPSGSSASSDEEVVNYIWRTLAVSPRRLG